MEKEEAFLFKNFKVIQNSTSVFKVNTDAVLLASFVDIITSNSSVLEIGSGTGVISLCVADKFKSLNPNITAIDIDEQAYHLTDLNFKHSGFSNLTAIHQSLNEFQKCTSRKFDLIVSNPPYHTETYFSTKERNIKAKYTTSLPFEELLSNSLHLLKNEGKFYIIIPTSQLETIHSILNTIPLYIHKIIKIYPKESKSSNRIILEFSKMSSATTVEPFVIYSEDNTYTEAYIERTKNFYLKF